MTGGYGPDSDDDNTGWWGPRGTKPFHEPLAEKKETPGILKYHDVLQRDPPAATF